jgi:hypothetical protein
LRAFVDTLRDIRDGELLNELPRKLQEVIEGVQATGKKGKLTIVLELSPAKANMFVLTDDVKQVIPEPERDTTTVFFITEESDLSRRDPRQPKLPEMGPRGVIAPMAQPQAERTVQNNG